MSGLRQLFSKAPQKSGLSQMLGGRNDPWEEPKEPKSREVSGTVLNKNKAVAIPTWNRMTPNKDYGGPWSMINKNLVPIQTQGPQAPIQKPLQQMSYPTFGAGYGNVFGAMATQLQQADQLVTPGAVQNRQQRAVLRNQQQQGTIFNDMPLSPANQNPYLIPKAPYQGPGIKQGSNNKWGDYWGSYADEDLKAGTPEWVRAHQNANTYLGTVNPFPMGDPYETPWFNLNKGTTDNGSSNGGSGGSGWGNSYSRGGYSSSGAAGRSSNWMSGLASWRIG